jgi:hypothetical protein
MPNRIVCPVHPKPGTPLSTTHKPGRNNGKSPVPTSKPPTPTQTINIRSPNQFAVLRQAALIDQYDSTIDTIKINLKNPPPNKSKHNKTKARSEQVNIPTSVSSIVESTTDPTTKPNVLTQKRLITHRPTHCPQPLHHPHPSTLTLQLILIKTLQYYLALNRYHNLYFWHARTDLYSPVDIADRNLRKIHNFVYK